ncbi:MAG: amidohydrolase family protein [Acidobacteriota bacterium]
MAAFLFHSTLRSTSFRAGCCLILAAAFWGAPAAAAEPPRIYAITHATVIPEPGRRIDAGTVVIRDGLIESVGTGLPVPDDAVEINGSGKWVYPGLIDADSQLGLPAPGPPPGTGAPPFARPRPETPAGAIHDIARIHPETRAQDQLRPFEGDRKRDVERLRELGFTTAVVTPEKGLLRGKSVAIDLVVDRPVAQIILREDVAQNAAFERGRFGEGYPTSLMGAVAALRQTLLDAERHAAWAKRYADHPEGMRRPEHHAAYEALAPVLDREQPVVFHTEDPRDTLLADALGREFDLDVLVSTSSYEWERAPEIAATGRGLIVSAGFPDKPEVEEDDEALDVSRDEMRRYLDAAGGPARLHEAGVTFAFTLHGLKNTADLPRQMRKITEAGLPESDVLAAWTTIPAQFLGLDRMVGRLAPGAIANVLVANGALFAEKTKIVTVFVDGIKHQVKQKKKPEGDPDAIVDPRGDWSVTMDFGGRAIQRQWTVKGRPGAYAGTAETQRGTVSFESVELAGNVLTVAFPARGGRPRMEITVIIRGDHFKGTAEMGPRSVKIQGTRTSGPEGGNR